MDTLSNSTLEVESLRVYESLQPHPGTPERSRLRQPLRFQLVPFGR